MKRQFFSDTEDFEVLHEDVSATINVKKTTDMEMLIERFKSAGFDVTEENDRVITIRRNESY